MDLESKFKDFSAHNPHIYAIFCDKAIKIIESGKKPSAKTIVVEMRQDKKITTTSQKFGTKIDTDFIALYARAFNADYPKYRNPFATRKGNRVNNIFK
jgi:hypothetical protein